MEITYLEGVTPYLSSTNQFNSYFASYSVGRSLKEWSTNLGSYYSHMHQTPTKTPNMSALESQGQPEEPSLCKKQQN